VAGPKGFFVGPLGDGGEWGFLAIIVESRGTTTSGTPREKGYKKM